MHGAHNATECVGVEPAAAPVEDQGLGWKNRCGKGNAEDTITSGLQGAWTYNPTQWDPTTYLSNLLTLEWRRTDSPAGKTQWVPTNESPHNAVPDAHIPGEVHAPVMTTADLALVHDSQYLAIAERFLAHPDELEAAFARAWFKLTHRDMGPRSRYLGPDVPDTIFLWQDHVTTPEFLISESDAGELKAEIIASSLTVSELVGAAWASASTFRASDMRGGANGARVALVPQKSWPVNNPIQLALVLKGLREIKAAFNEDPAHTTQVSLADMIVLGGATAIEKAARDAGVEVEVPFTPGRGDATQAQTDVASFAVLEPAADAFRNFYNASTAHRPPTEMLVDRASQLTLTVPEMTALLGGMRVLGVNHNASTHGVLTDRPGMLTTDFFVNLLDMGTMWHSTATCAGTAADVCVYEGVDRESGAVKYTATQVDLVFGSHAELRAVAEVYAYEGAHEAFVRDFVSAWVKVMQADRFDLHKK
jgi:catalase-peroxidase